MNKINSLLNRIYRLLLVARVCDVGRSFGTVDLFVDAVTRDVTPVALPVVVLVGGLVDW